MHNNKAESTKNKHRIPVMAPEGMKEALSNASRRQGVSTAAIARRAIREWFERAGNCLICPACWEVIRVSPTAGPQWHTHDKVEVTGEMWW